MTPIVKTLIIKRSGVRKYHMTADVIKHPNCKMPPATIHSSEHLRGFDKAITAIKALCHCKGSDRTKAIDYWLGLNKITPEEATLLYGLHGNEVQP